MIFELTDTEKAAPLFGGWEETLIWSCLQGIMGKVYANDRNHPTAAMAILGDFTFFAGVQDAELAAYQPDWCTQSFMIMVPQHDGWKHMILGTYSGKTTVVSRYAIKKEPGIFDHGKLAKAAGSLPETCRLQMIDERLYQMCRSEVWSSDLVSQFPDYETYRRLGIGAVVCQNDTILSGASSYSRYRDGIEIEIDTREDYRRRGFALASGARLILECLKRNLYPSWDAHNLGSVALAEKLGYHYSHTYTAIEVRR